MERITQRLLMLALCVLCWGSCAKNSFETKPGANKMLEEKPDDFLYSEIEWQLLVEINDYRTSVNLPALKPLSKISREAQIHSLYMAEKGELSHDNFGARYNELVASLGAKTVSENVAFGYRTAEAVINAWIKSDGHRHNIEADHTHFGVAVEHDKDGRNYFTIIFVRK